MQAGEIQIKLTLDNGQFSVETKKAGQTIQELKRSIDQTANSTLALEKHFTGLYQKFHDTVRTASLLRYALHDITDLFTLLPGSILKSSGEMERMQTLMVGMSKATDDYAKKAEAVANTKFIFNMAQNTPFEVKALTDAFVKFKSAGLDPTNGSMKGLVDSVARFGGTSETLHRASIAIQQMAGKGVISMEELRQQLGEAVPNAIGLMAQGAGMSIARFSKLVSTGTVEASQSLRNMFTVMQIENKGASEAMMDTWTGMLSLLKTKFELFKVEAGDNQFFKEAKDAVRDLIEAFDSIAAKQLAMNLGQAFGEMVKAIKESIEFIVKYGDQIKTVGELLLIYWGASKVAGLLSGVREIFRQRVEMYEQEILKAEEANRRKAKADAEEAARLRNKATNEEAYAARSTQLAGKLYAEQARYAQQIAALEARNLGWAGQQKIDRLNARLQETRQAIVEIQNEAVARRQQADVMRQQAEAFDRVAAATRMGTAASAADMLVVRQVNDHAAKTTQLLRDKAGATTLATSGVNGLTRAMSGARVVFDMFGGWIGIAVTSLAFLADKLFEFLDRWKEAEEVRKRIESGISSQKDVDNTKARISEVDRGIAGTQNFLNRRQRPEMGDVDPNTSRGRQIKADQEFYDAQVKELERLKNEREKLLADLSSGEAILSKASTDAQAARYRRDLETTITKRFAMDNAEIKRIEQQISDKQDELVRKGANSVQVEKATADERKQIIAIRQKSAQDQLDYLKVERTKLEAELDKTAGKEARDKINAKLDILREERQGLITKATQLRDDAMKLGQIGLTKKPEGDKPEDPLLRYVLEKENNLAKAKVRLDNEVRGTADIVAKRNEAIIEVLGNVAEGKFDKSLGKDDDDVKRREYKGGIEERKKAVAEFMAQLQAGNADVAAFVNSLKNFDEAQKKLILRAIDASASEEVLKERLKGVAEARRQEAKTAEEAEAALISLESNGYGKMSTGMLQLEKYFAALQARLKDVTADMSEFAAVKTAAFTNQSMADARKWVEDQNKATRDVEQATVKATQSASEAREAEHRENLRRINEGAAAQEAALMRMLSEEEQSAERKKQLIQEMNRVQIAAENARDAETRRYVAGSNQQMVELKKQWGDSVTAMNQLSVNWSNTFMDNLVNVISGTKVSWKAMVSSMAKDLLGVILKNTIGQALAGMMGSLTAGIGSMLGLSSAAAGAGAATQASQAAAVSAAMTTMTTSTGTAMTGMTTAMGELAIGGTTAFSEMALTTTGAMGEMVLVVTTAMAEMAAASSAGAFFADGGIMTSSGPLPLNMYANGGVANKPQMAIFGEGSTPEAYVPLPDGRSIPVTMTGTGNITKNTTNQGGVVINIAVTNSGEQTNATGDEADQWKRMASRVRGVVMEELVTQQRPGGVLAK